MARLIHSARMGLPADYHMHTPLCRHATGEPVEYAAQALRLGLTEIGFSDHSPMVEDDFDDWRMRNDQLDEYVEKVRYAQREHPQLTIRLALEVDYLPDREDWIRALAKRHSWDYFIGSVHYISGGWNIDSPFKHELWERCDVDAVWTEYFQRLTRAAASGLFEIIGHADLPKKFGHFPKRDLTPLLTDFLGACKATDTAIELNTAGLRKDCREIYPSRMILEMARAQGVAITFGSDAHAPGEVGADFAKAIALAIEAGFTKTRRFAARRKADVPISG
jgi:histidinol-phosphatase (PHP family)